MNLRVKDVAGLLSVSEKTIYRMIKNEAIPCFRIGGQWRFDRGEILSWVEETRESSRHVQEKFSPLQDEDGISISEFLRRGNVFYNVTGNSKESAILSSLTLIKAGFPQADVMRLFDAMMAREKLCSTAIGHGIAFPHPRPFIEFASTISSISLCFLERPIPFDALDNEDVGALFFIFPRNERRHLRILAKLSRMLKDDDIISAIKKALPKDELLAVFSKREAVLFEGFKE